VGLIGLTMRHERVGRPLRRVVGRRV